MRTYAITNSDTGLNVTVEAVDLEEANLKALLVYGLDAVGCNIVCKDNNSFRMNVCYSVWQRMLNEYCPKASMVDVYNFELATLYYNIGKYTREEAIAKSRLWRWIIRTGFSW